MTLPMAIKTTHTFEPDYTVPAGETLEEFMHLRGMPQTELADHTGLTLQTLNRILQGEQPISLEIANKLGDVTDYPAQFWKNLEAQYREQLVKLHEGEKLLRDRE